MRPALDLLNQIGDLPEGDIVDLGCGNGPVGPSLAARFAGRNLIGVDASPAMLKAAKKTGSYSKLIRADA
ncbi:MAG: methyltransferase domain-containing protein, partial [Marinosulfonomonas sp.]|nr:methyltransferase domain-containing protein [Marinosulfonomonas sp.]